MTVLWLSGDTRFHLGASTACIPSGPLLPPQLSMYIMHNGASKGFAWSGQGTGHRGTGTYSVVLFLNQGSYVQTFVGSGGEFKRHLASYNFTGHLVKAWQ